MKIVENKKKNTNIFENLKVGEIFRCNGGLIYVKIADYFLAREVEDCIDDGELYDIDQVYDNYSAKNAFCLNSHQLIVLEDWMEVEPIECELHIV